MTGGEGECNDAQAEQGIRPVVNDSVGGEIIDYRMRARTFLFQSVNIIGLQSPYDRSTSNKRLR